MRKVLSFGWSDVVVGDSCQVLVSQTLVRSRVHTASRLPSGERNRFFCELRNTARRSHRVGSRVRDHSIFGIHHAYLSVVIHGGGQFAIRAPSATNQYTGDAIGTEVAPVTQFQKTICPDSLL